MDLLLEKVFDKNRWDEAVLTGNDKGIDRAILKQLCLPMNRAKLKEQLEKHEYVIMPPHEAQIPKDNGDFRTVYVNTGTDRVLLSIINDVIFELCSDLVHSNCKSYQKGLSCGKTVQKISHRIVNMTSDTIGVKIDLTKYFDSVPIEYIDDVFDKIEKRTGPSCVLDLLRKYYHTDIVFDLKKKPIHKYSSLRQGCAFAAFLADSVLYDIDDTISRMDVEYVRYSDDILIIGNNWENAYAKLHDMLNSMTLTLNPKKIETLHKDKWFKFLGFSLKNGLISLSASRIKTFQHEIEKCTINQDETDIDIIISAVNHYLYAGPDGYCWATSVLPVINTDNDIQILNGFVMDAIRAAYTGKKKIGGLGTCKNKSTGIIVREKGRNVRQNKEKIPTLSNYMTLKCMQNAILTSKQAFDLLVATM